MSGGGGYESFDWGALLGRATAEWQEFQDIPVSRALEDERLKRLQARKLVKGSDWRRLLLRGVNEFNR